VLATAIDAGCDILVTGDSRHFGPLFGRTLGRLKILSPVDTARPGGAGSSRGVI
jgi:hypothetical protein